MSIPKRSHLLWAKAKPQSKCRPSIRQTCQEIIGNLQSAGGDAMPHAESGAWKPRLVQTRATVLHCTAAKTKLVTGVSRFQEQKEVYSTPAQKSVPVRRKTSRNHPLRLKSFIPPNPWIHRDERPLSISSPKDIHDTSIIPGHL